jgi:hypothetical protein
MIHPSDWRTVQVLRREAQPFTVRAVNAKKP